MTAPALLLLLAACFPRLDGLGDDGTVGDDGNGDAGSGADGGGDDGGGDDGGGDDGSSPVPPSLTTSYPAHGSNLGGLRVTIEGADLGDDPRVYFGSQEATVRSATDDRVTVDTPEALGVVGPVDIRITTDGGEASLDGGFQYWEDATGSAVTVLRTRAIQGWDDAGTWTDFQAVAWNTNPVDAWATDALAATGGCTSAWPGGEPLPAPDAMWVDGSLGRLDLDYSEEEEIFFLNDDFPDVDTVAGSRHDVHLDEGGAWPAYTVDGGVEFADALELTNPDPFDYYAYDRDDFTIEWEGWGADRVVIGIFDYASDAGVVCTTTNSGQFTVPDSVYEFFVPVEDLAVRTSWVMQVIVIAYSDTASTLDFNNGQLRAQGGVGYATWALVEDSWL